MDENKLEMNTLKKNNMRVLRNGAIIAIWVYTIASCSLTSDEIWMYWWAGVEWDPQYFISNFLMLLSILVYIQLFMFFLVLLLNSYDIELSGAKRLTFYTFDFLVIFIPNLLFESGVIGPNSLMDRLFKALGI